MRKQLTFLGAIALIVILLATSVVGAAPAGRENVSQPPAPAAMPAAASLSDVPFGQPQPPERAAEDAAPAALIGAGRPGAYYLDGGGTYMDPNQYPVRGAMRFFGWSDFQGSPGNYTWTVLENWVNERYAQGLSTGVFVSTYDGIYDGDIRNTPDFVIKMTGTTVVTNEFVDYMSVRNNGDFESSNHSAAWDRDPTSRVVVTNATPGGSWAGRLGGTANTEDKLTHWVIRVPAMPPELTSGIKMDLQFDTYVDTTDIVSDTDHLYVELLDGGTNLLLQVADITNTNGPVGSWVTSPQYDLSNFVGRSLKVRFRATNDGTAPSTFYVDNVKMRVRLIIPKYWSPTYKKYYGEFIQALGDRVRDNPKVDFVTVGTGLHGENQPCNTEHKPYMRSAGLTSDLWVATVNEITDMYVKAFSQGYQLKKNLLMAYMPYFEVVQERVKMANHAAELGVGLSNNGLNPDFINVFMPDGIGAYDPIVSSGGRYNYVPIAWETYSYMLCTPVYAYWAIISGLDKHADYLRIGPDVLNGPDGPANLPIFQWAQKYWGQKVTTTPGVWVYMREHRNPTPYCYVRGWPSYVYNKNGTPNVYVQPGTSYASSTYPQLGNFSFWLYQDDTIAGGRTVPETNDKGADSRYAVHPSTGMKLTDAGLGNCPTVNQYMRAPANYPCNNQPYNPDLPPLEGSSSSNYYDPNPWTGAGKEAWVIRRTDQATGNPYMWFNIDDQFIDGSEVYSVNIKVKYLDLIDSKRVVTPTTTPDTWVLRYDSLTGEKVATGAAVPDGVVTKTGDKQIKEVVFTIRDGKFANRLASGKADFVIDSRSPTGVNDGNEWIHMVEVTKLGAEPEPTATPTPSPTPTETPTPTITPTATPTTGIVEGKAFHDQNANGVLDPGEPGLPGAVLALSKLGVEKYTATSGPDGTYRFEGVTPDQYTLAEKTPPPGYLPNTMQVIVPVMANQTITMDFGHQPAPTPTPTVTNTPTSTPTETPTPTPTATATPTSTPTPERRGLYLPLIQR